MFFSKGSLFVLFFGVQKVKFLRTIFHFCSSRQWTGVFKECSLSCYEQETPTVYALFKFNRLVSNCAGTKEQSEVQGNNLHFPLFWTIQYANYSPEPRLCSFVTAHFETGLLHGWLSFSIVSCRQSHWNDQSFYHLPVSRIYVCCTQGHLRKLAIAVNKTKIISELFNVDFF